MEERLQLNIVNYYKGAYVIIEDRPSNGQFYIIKKGTVSISREASNHVETLHPGDFFGVISAMSGHKYIETAIAETDISLIIVNRNQFPLLIQKNAPIAMKIILSFSKRLRELDKSIAELSVKSQTVNIDDIINLFNVAEYYAGKGQYNQAYYAYYKFLQYCHDNEFAPIAREALKQMKEKSHAVFLTPKEDEFKRLYPDNTMICCEHEPGNELYIIQKGKIKITKVIQQKEVLLAVLKEGDIFGEMALLENKPRSASAIAFGDTKLLAVNKDNFKTMISTQPQLVTKLISLLAERTWVVYRQLANLRKTDKMARFYDILLIQIEKNHLEETPMRPHLFEFGPKEWINMVGIDPEEGKEIIQEIFNNKKFTLKEGKIYLSEVDELLRLNSFYKKMEELKKKKHRP